MRTSKVMANALKCTINYR